MRTVHNVHERPLATTRADAARLLDALASPEDALWPRDRWPAMRLRPRLEEGAAGGHGPIRYRVERYVPGRVVRFRFVAPRGFLGTHAFEVLEDAAGVRLRHTVDMRVTGWATLSWPLVFRPLHDALVEDALDQAARVVGGAPPATRGERRWSPRVRLLRSLLGLLIRRRDDAAGRAVVAAVLLVATLVALLAVCLAPARGQAQQARADGASLIAFHMRDQFGREHTTSTFANRPLVIIGCDRGGSRHGAPWAAAFRDAVAAERSGVVIVSVATLRGVPRVLRRAAIARFPTDTARWSLLDWDGEFARAYSFAEYACTIVAFDGQGRVRHRVAVRELEPRVVRETLGRLGARAEGATP